jgi:hypothetical protein
MGWALDWSEKEKEGIHNFDGKKYIHFQVRNGCLGGGGGVQFDMDLRPRGCEFC